MDKLKNKKKYNIYLSYSILKYIYFLYVRLSLTLIYFEILDQKAHLKINFKRLKKTFYRGIRFKKNTNGPYGRSEGMIENSLSLLRRG